MSELGERIHIAREMRGMSQDAVALAIGVTREAIAQWETGVKQPRLRNLISLADCLAVDVGWLIRGPLPHSGPRSKKLPDGENNS